MVGRLKVFDTGRVPWDLSIISIPDNFDCWANHPRAILRFNNKGTKVYIYILTLTEYQASRK